jgi:type II secretory ATPase GspE/PulE/Tfp pilus assembly ATPase PilB-like protein
VTTATLPTRPDHIERYTDVGDYLRVLTEGQDPLYSVPTALADSLLALDLGALRASIIRSDVTSGMEMTQHLRALRSKLVTRGYTVTTERTASSETLRDIRRNAGSRQATSASGGPKALFDAWVQCAEEMDASDLHIEMRAGVAEVRVRVDNKLIPLGDAAEGRYSRKDAEDAVSAAFAATRSGNTGSHYQSTLFVDCMIEFNTPRAGGYLRFQNLKGKWGPKVVVRMLRSVPAAS